VRSGPDASLCLVPPGKARRLVFEHVESGRRVAQPPDVPMPPIVDWILVGKIGAVA
jgi:hypothetical protein